MENGGVFLFAVLAIFFVLWLVGGGPHKSIYSDGIFITPITNVGQEQVAYGPKISFNKSVSVGPATITASTSALTNPSSQYEGYVTVARTTQTTSSNPNQQFLEFAITSSATSAYNLNGWRFVSTSDGNSAVISTTDVQLSPRQTILIVTSFPSSDTHDTMRLEDSTGNLVSSVTF